MKETNILRIGKVSSTNPKTATVKVVFSDMDNMVSHDLPLLFPQGLKNKVYAMPDVGENVVCLFIEQGVGDGYCIGCFYTDTEIPPVTDQNKVHYAFEDGTWIEYDRCENKLKVNAIGDIEITVAKNIKIEAAKEVSVQCENLGGSFKTGNISGDNITVSAKSLTATCSTGDIQGDNINLSGVTISISGDVSITGNISLEGNVSCPGYCKC